MTPAERAVLRRLREHADAPRWNHAAGDRLGPGDLEALDAFRGDLRARRTARSGGAPHAALLQRIAERVPHVASFRDRVPPGFDLEGRWDEIRTMSREDIAVRVADLVPDDADLGRLIVYRTAGTSGHALLVPHDPRATASYQPLIETAVERHGVRVTFDADAVACFLVGAQRRTVTYPATLSAWNGAGFAKLNLHATEWPREGSAARYFADLAPRLLTGDPISFSEMLRQGIDARPAAMISTAVAMSAGLRRRLAAAFGCPVIDWYSLTETGPIGYACAAGEGYHVLPHDLHVEVIRPDGRAAPVGERGEIAVSGGRNPFLPLLRYRTGDFGRIDFSPCACGDAMPRLLDLEGRAPVLFRAADGSVVNPVDLSRILREFPLVQHEMTQRADRSCELVVRPLGAPRLDGEALVLALRAALGDVPISLRVDPTLGDRAEGKVLPYRSELLLED